MKNKDITLIIMAAGIGSRFGGGIKQLEKLGPSGEIIMDYSIYDALEAGFNKVVFIIRKDMEDEFKAVIGNRIRRYVDVEYVYQALEDIPEGFCVPKGRMKPWGTGQAVLCCKDIVKEPFVLINADDFYGREAFHKLYDFLAVNQDFTYEYEMCMAGFHLKNTLSENGGVTRGVCITDGKGILNGVSETMDVRMEPDGSISHSGTGTGMEITPDHYVSMNMWGGYPAFFECLEAGFRDFLENLTDDAACTKEYFLPGIIDEQIKKGRARVRVLETGGTWFGVTYREDAGAVRKALEQLSESGVYQRNLWDGFRKEFNQ